LITAKNVLSKETSLQQSDGTNIKGAKRLKKPILVEINGKEELLHPIWVPNLPHDLILGVKTCKRLRIIDTNQNKGPAIKNIPLIDKFFKEFDELPMRTQFDCRIELKGELPTQRYRYRQYTDDKMDFIKSFIQTNLRKNLKESANPKTLRIYC
jgi:hypothetical protein